MLILYNDSDGPRPTRDEIIKLRSFMLLYVKELIMKGQGILDDELQSMLNYLTTLHEVTCQLYFEKCCQDSTNTVTSDQCLNE